MSHVWSFNTGNLTGPIVEKITAIRSAGFAAATLWHSDLFPPFDDPDGAVTPFRQSRLALSAYQMVRDLEGAAPAVRAHKLEIARQLIDQLLLLGGDTLVLASNGSAELDRDWDAAVAALRAIGDIGKSRGVRIAFEPLCYTPWINDYRLGWKLVRDADHSHVGLVLDPAHIFLVGSPLDDIATIPGAKIFLVELNDLPDTGLNIREMLRNYRMFPGEGRRPLGEFLRLVLATGYRGHFALEVFNATYRAMDPLLVARRGHASLEKLFEKVGA
jgi:3-dehydroshikimate dehydratase